LLLGAALRGRFSGSSFEVKTGQVFVRQYADPCGVAEWALDE
jgi:hypothetical protein